MKVKNKIMIQRRRVYNPILRKSEIKYYVLLKQLFPKGYPAYRLHIWIKGITSNKAKAKELKNKLIAVCRLRNREKIRHDARKKRITF